MCECEVVIEFFWGWVGAKEKNKKGGANYGLFPYFTLKKLVLPQGEQSALLSGQKKSRRKKKEKKDLSKMKEKVVLSLSLLLSFLEHEGL